MTCEGLASVGSLQIVDDQGAAVFAELIGFGEGLNKLVPYVSTAKIVAGARVWLMDGSVAGTIDDSCLGRAFDALMEPLDQEKGVSFSDNLSLHGEQINPLERAPIDRRSIRR